MNLAYRRRWIILAVQSIAILAIILSSTTISIALPSIQIELQTTMSDLQWLMNAYMLSFAAFGLVAGWIGDRIGTKPVLIAGLILFTLANALAGFAGSALALILLRACMGLGAAMILPSTLSIISRIFPDSERGKAIGVWAGMNSLGIALGPIAGGLLVESWGWTSVFWVNVPAALIATLAAALLIPRSEPGNAGRLDLPGALLSTAGIGLLMYGLTRTGSEGWGDPVALMCMALAAALLTVFAIVSGRSESGLFRLKLFGDRRFSIAVAALALMSLGLVGVTFSLTLYLQFVGEYSPLEAGIRLLPFAFGVFFGAGIAHKVAKKTGPKAIIAVGFLGSALMSLLIAGTTPQTPYAAFGAMLFGLSFFLGFVAATATDTIMGSLPADVVSSGSAMSTVVRTLSGALGIAILGSILSLVYTASFERAIPSYSELAALPPAAASAASESIGAAAAIAQKLPDAMSVALKVVSRQSFMDAWNILAWIAVWLNIAASLLVLFFLPGRARVQPVATDNPEAAESAT